MASQGYYVIALCQREIPTGEAGDAYAAVQAMRREEVEKAGEYRFLGLLHLGRERVFNFDQRATQRGYILCLAIIFLKQPLQSIPSSANSCQRQFPPPPHSTTTSARAAGTPSTRSKRAT